MNCDQVTRLLDDYLDGELPAGREREVGEHLGRCLACRRQQRDLARLLQAAGELPAEIEPENELWPGVERRLGAAAAGTPRRHRRRYLAAAAALVAAVAVPLLLYRAAPRGPQVVATDLVAREQVLARANQARSEDGVLHAHTDLRSVIERQRDVLAPETLEVVEENLRILDEAVAQLRDALDQDPMNRRLNLLLATRYQQEAEMLKRVNRI